MGSPEPTSRVVNPGCRGSAWLPRTAIVALARVAQHHGISQRAMVERLITAADERIVRRLEPDTPEWASYFRVTW